MEVSENVILEAQKELAAVKNELQRLEQLKFSSELKDQRIESLRQEIQQVEGFLKL